ARESHWLRVAPEATAALVWNQLRRSRWSTEKLGRELQISANTSFLRVRRVATRESPALERTLVGHAHRVSACAVTPDGRRVVWAAAGRALGVGPRASGAEVGTLRGHAAGVSGCAVTLDGRRVVSASADKTLKVWDLATGQEIATLHGHAAGVSACAVTPD